jgi:hypothetical protein
MHQTLKCLLATSLLDLTLRSLGCVYSEANWENVRNFEYVEEVANRQERGTDFQIQHSQDSG